MQSEGAFLQDLARRNQSLAVFVFFVQQESKQIEVTTTEMREMARLDFPFVRDLTGAPQAASRVL
jgi:hypothetical protein